MAMTTIPALTAEGSKYQLKTIHAEIDLLDRRLAHMEKYDTFATDAAKAAATRKLMLKRKPLEESARRMAAEGVEFLHSELPRSFRPEGEPAPVRVAAVEEEPAAVAAPEKKTDRRQSGSPIGGGFDWEKAVAQYKVEKNA
jgi:hypothetical protein